MRSNKLWESMRLILPEMREKATKRCFDCRFLVQIQGQEEVRPGCVVSIIEYGTLQRRVPATINIRELMRLTDYKGLKEILERGKNPENQACGLFKPRIKI